MSKMPWSSMSTTQLVEQFAAIAREQDQAILANAAAKYNRLYDRMADVVDELKSRPGDQRRELAMLYEFPSMQVRLKAAIHTLAVAPIEARGQLEAIAESKWFPQAGDAGMSLWNLDRGVFNPS